MKFYKLEVYVFDFEGIGPSDIISDVEDTPYFATKVMKSESVDIDWTDDHELNKTSNVDVYRKYFGTELK